MEVKVVQENESMADVVFVFCEKINKSFIEQLLQEIKSKSDCFDDQFISKLAKALTNDKLRAKKVDVDNVIKLVASDGSAKDYFGWSVAVSDTKIAIGAFEDDGGRGSVYVYDLDGTNEIKLTASDGVPGDQFGWSVAISDNKIVVGARKDNNKNGNDSGCVYVYDLDGTNEIKITASDGAADDWFGYSVAISGNKIVVGALRDDHRNSKPGCAYIYDLDGANEIKLTASDGVPGDKFGYSVAISNTKVVVGAHQDDDKGRDSGSVYVYDLDGTNEIKLTASDGEANAWFGHSVAVSDTKIVIGSIYDNDKGSGSGSAYIYDLDGTNEIKLTASDGAASDYFGHTVSISDTKIVISAYNDNDKGTASGSAYIYDLDGTNEIKLTASDGAAGDKFGWSVAASNTKIVIGARDDVSNSGTGSAYIFGLIK